MRRRIHDVCQNNVEGIDMESDTSCMVGFSRPITQVLYWASDSWEEIPRDVPEPLLEMNPMIVIEVEI